MPKNVLSVLMVALSAMLAGAAPESFSAERAIEQLADPEFKKRNAAQEQLLEWGKERIDAAIEKFYGTYRTHDDPEVRARSRDLLKALVVMKQSRDGEGYIGIMMREDDVAAPGGGFRKAVRITAVMEDTPAERAKLQVGDLVMAIDEVNLAEEGSINTFSAYVRSKKPNAKVSLHLQRNNEAMEIVVQLMRRPRIPQPDMQFWGEGFRVPSVEETEEEDFQRWLQQRAAKEKMRSE